MIRLLIADDHPVVRAGLCALFEHTPDIKVVEEISHGGIVVDTALTLWPNFDLLVLDARMPGFNPVTTVQRLCEELAGLKILILSSYDDREYVIGLLNAGARGYLLKDEPRATIMSALRIIADGDMYISPKIASIYVRHQRDTGEERDQLLVLTSREIEVLQLVGAGYDNQEIGAALTISHETVKNHLRNIYSKLNLTNRYQAITFAFRNQLVRGDERTRRR